MVFFIAHSSDVIDYMTNQLLSLSNCRAANALVRLRNSAYASRPSFIVYNIASMYIFSNVLAGFWPY